MIDLWGFFIIVFLQGYIEPFADQKIEVKFLPGVPEIFHKDFHIQVAHFQPDVINITGEGNCGLGLGKIRCKNYPVMSNKSVTRKMEIWVLCHNYTHFISKFLH